MEQAPEPEVADSDCKSEDYVVADCKSTTTEVEEKHEPTTLDKLKNWLNGFMKDIAE